MGPLHDAVLTARTRRFLLQRTDPSVRYLALKDLYDQRESDSQVAATRAEIGRKGWA